MLKRKKYIKLKEKTFLLLQKYDHYQVNIIDIRNSVQLFISFTHVIDLCLIVGALSEENGESLYILSLKITQKF